MGVFSSLAGAASSPFRNQFLTPRQFTAGCAPSVLRRSSSSAFTIRRGRPSCFPQPLSLPNGRPRQGHLRRRCAGAARPCAALRAPVTRPPARRNPAAIRGTEQTQASPAQGDHDRETQKSNACGHRRMQVRRISRGSRTTHPPDRHSQSDRLVRLQRTGGIISVQAGSCMYLPRVLPTVRHNTVHKSGEPCRWCGYVQC